MLGWTRDLEHGTILGVTQNPAPFILRKDLGLILKVKGSKKNNPGRGALDSRLTPVHPRSIPVDPGYSLGVKGV